MVSVSLSAHAKKLRGGIITSTDNAERAGHNQLSTGTLTWRDINNHSDFEGKGIGLSGAVTIIGKEAEGNDSGRTLISKSLAQGIGHDDGHEGSVTHSGINTANIVIKKPDEQQRLTGKTAAETIASIKTDISTEAAAANSGRLANNFDKDDVFKELNLQVKVTKDFKQNANQQISKLLDDKQAAAREELWQAINSGDTDKREAALQEIYKLQYERRFLETLVGIVAGSPDGAITQGTLALAATKMREETARNSLLFPGIVDKSGKVLSNVSAQSSAFDGLKLGGVRVGLDVICREDNSRCVTANDIFGNKKLDAKGIPMLKYDSAGRVIYKGDKNHPTLTSLLEDKEMSAKLYGPTGGFQGSGGLLGPFSYKPGTIIGDIIDGVIESFAGTHDYIGGQLPGFYDKEGNTTRDRSKFINVAAETWTVAAIPLAAPFAAADFISPDVLQFIFAASN